MQTLKPATLLKTDSNTGIFLWYLRTFKEHIFYRTPPVAASENNEQQQLSEGFANKWYKIASSNLLQLMILPFASTAVEHLLFEDVTNSHSFGN